MPENARELIIFPTELALRRYQQEQALLHGWVDASSHTTFARLRKLSLPYAKLKGRRMNPAQELLLRRQAVEVALGHFSEGGILGNLSESALADVLENLVAELAALPGQLDQVVDWLLSRSPTHKLYQLGILFSVWRTLVKQEGLVDAVDENNMILRLLKGRRENWPALLRDARSLTFRSVRWFNPFEESCVAALNQKMKLRIESALPPAHAEQSADRLGQRIRTEIMDEPWAAWAEDLGDALAVDNADVLQRDDADRICFSRSAGAYGEIEDLARRICWNIQHQSVSPNRIALVVPDIGTVQDIIPHVFGRFGIPYYFRRGRPVLSSPCVKAFFDWLSYPLRPERDRLIDLIRNPAIHFDDREETVASLLKRKTPPRVDLKNLPYFHGTASCSGLQAQELRVERVIEPEDHFNAEALKAVESTLEQLGKQKMPLQRLVDLVEELLQDATIRPRDSHEQGVWILNPHDAVGIDFDGVYFSGLNEGEFPSVPQQDALLNDKERYSLRMFLEEQGITLPKMALPSADVLFEQESVLFLTALGMAREQLVLSYQAVDQEGNEKGEGDYYRKLWNLAGWCAQDKMILSPYDQWRIARFEGHSIFSNHVRDQQAAEAEDRVPMPGESFLAVIPLPLCRAKDEALQVAARSGRKTAENTDPEYAPEHLPQAERIISILAMEAERAAFLDAPADEREASLFCGHLPGVSAKIKEWFDQKGELSPTALEGLAQGRYIFLLDRIFGFEHPRTADDTPDPMDRGGLIHTILFRLYSALANGESGIEAPRFWAVKTADGWRKRNEQGMDAVPLVSFEPGLSDEYLQFAERTSIDCIQQAVRSGRMLGHPGVWAAEQEKVLIMVRNFVQYDLDTCAAENRFPALFEMQFGCLRNQPGVIPAVELAQSDERVKLHGIIDRVDLVFSDSGELAKLRVLDYKGSSRARKKPEDYMDEIRRNLDCQLPVYAFAAQQFFLDTFNTPETNALTEAGYLFYERDYSKMNNTIRKSLIAMEEPDLLPDFLNKLFENINRLKNGDFAVDPLIASYNDYTSICRTEAVRREELD